MTSAEPLHIFIGPMKTGTTWLHQLLLNRAADKEIYFPRRLFRHWVYRKYVADRSVLVWPYLLHHPGSLWSLLDVLETQGRPAMLYLSWRDPSAWRSSMGRYRHRNSRTSHDDDIAVQERAIRSTVRKLMSHHRVTCVRLINPRACDIRLLSAVTTLPTKDIAASTGDIVYPTTQVARVSSRWLGRLFFRAKPFLPGPLRHLNRSMPGLRAVFFRSR